MVDKIIDVPNFEPLREGLGYDERENAGHLLAPCDAKALDEGKWIRADGATACNQCGLLYRQHPQVQGALWLRRICHNLLVKL